MTNDASLNFTVTTPHHYLIQLIQNWKDRFKDSNVDLLKLQTDLECDEANFVYPTTFHAYMIFMKMVAIHASLMSTNTK